MGMFNNFSSKDFAKVLLIEEMSNISLIGVVKELLDVGVEAEVVSDFMNCILCKNNKKKQIMKKIDLHFLFNKRICITQCYKSFIL